MSELKFDIPRALEGEEKKIEKEVGELISFEEKRKLLVIFIDEIMKGSKQLNKEDLIKLEREIKKGRFQKLKEKGLV